MDGTGPVRTKRAAVAVSYTRVESYNRLDRSFDKQLSQHLELHSR